MKLRLPPLSRDKSDTLLLLATCVLVLLPHALRMPLWISAFCTVLLAWRGWITFRGRRMPSRWVLLPIACAAMAAGYVTHKTLFGRDAGVTLLVLLLVLKLLEMRARRDLFTAMFVSLFLVMANFFYTQSIGMAVLMGVTVVAVLTTQLSFQFTGLVPPLMKRFKLGAMVLGLAAPLTLVLFLLFPRIHGPLWNMPNDTVNGRSGLSDSMAPGNISNLVNSEEIAFRVLFQDPLPPPASLYWRGVVLADFDGRTWTQGARRQRETRLVWHGKPVRQQVTLEPSGHPWLFALDLPSAAPVLSEIRTGMTAEMQLMAARPLIERVRYDVASYLSYELQPNPDDLYVRPWLALPYGYNPATLEMGAKLRAENPDDAAIVGKVLQYFRREPFSYTRTPPLLGTNSVDEFLFTTRAGFCEHYASAFVVLMRAAGVPARVVTGYQGGELNPVDNYLVVRQSDAHAWAEVWFKGQGWRRVDPTAAVAPERIEKNLNAILPPPAALGGLLNFSVGNESLLGKLRFRWGALNNQWNQQVLNYSLEKQKALLESLGFSNPDWRTLIQVMLVCGLLVMAAVVLPLVWNRQKIDPAAALYQRLCRELARRGLPRLTWEGPHDYAQRLQQLPAPATMPAPVTQAALQFLELYQALMYAPHAPADSLSQLKLLLARCR